MKHFFKNAKRLLKQVLKIFSTISHNSIYQIGITLLSIPYIIWQIIVPIIPLGKIADSLAKIFRKILEKNKTKQVIGINLAIILLLISLSPLSVIKIDANQSVDEAVLKTPQIQISTEHTFHMAVVGYISQQFSWHHHGIDIAGNNGSSVFPIADGKVVEIAYSPFGYGKNIVIEHNNGFLSRYAHLQLVAVEINQSVDKNTILGLVGSTGWSTGPHLHLELYQNNRAVDPLAYLPSEFIKDVPSKPSLQTLIALKNNPVNILGASMSAQVEYKEVAEDFVDPNSIPQASESAQLDY